ncbi:neutral protease [Colletotrichum salicis]|uniref:Neutral protease n=1 Tax=Colletotrichum salicis TaxID=1209931 RepID=A0A135V1C8_9PEZI|nr:neutral protease [Colletotrichum salicis]
MRISHLAGLLCTVSGTLAATFKSCTAAQIVTLEAAIERATNKSLAAIEHLEDNPNGSDVQTTCTVVYATIGGTYGDVKICSVYFNEAMLPPTGRHRNQWDTIIHEATHMRDVLGTTDYGYDVDLCKQFALEDPEKAVKNADNHARFAVEVPPWGP